MHHNPISIKNLSYIYPDGNQALRDINLLIEGGEKVALIGANGSGKSTLLLHLNGLLIPQEGTVSIGKWAVESQNFLEIRNFVGLVFQNPEDQLFMPTCGEDIAFGLLNQGINGTELKERAQQAMTAVGLDLAKYEKRHPHHLSGGEQKRVAIAGVLAMNPQVLVFDEPSAQLDPRSRRQLIQLLLSLSETQIIATHDLDLALDICPRTVILNQGQIVYDGETDLILKDAEFLWSNALEPPLSYSCRKST